MREPSIIIHKGKKEEKYEIYIEDYVMSYLKEETGTLELSEFYFYGLRENDNKRYIVYGAGRNKNLTIFDKYTLLDELGCRLTQAGPVFLVREKNGIYEVKGYEVFYQDNKEMQNYLINRKIDNDGNNRNSNANKATNTYANAVGGRKIPQNKTPHRAISMQLCVILVALIAIVINSTNSYDKMTQLNQSALEVFFAIENQEAGDDTVVDIADSNLEQEEDVLKLAVLENEELSQEKRADETTETKTGEDTEESIETENTVTEDATTAENTATEETTVDETEQQENKQDTSFDEQEEVEALSRNVARYYEVEKGDTLYTISRKIYGDTTHVQKICELNQITNPDNIRYGQKIVLP